MFFDSIEFAIFIPIVFLLYWLLGNYKLNLQNILLLAASYFFYSCWDIRFLSLLIFSTSLDYFFALKIEQSNNNKFQKQLLVISIAINLGVLGFLNIAIFLLIPLLIYPITLD